MPHIIVKLFPGRTEQQKEAFTEKLIGVMKEELGASDKSISIAFEEVPRDEWVSKVYNKDINTADSNLYKKPGYNPEDI